MAWPHTYTVEKGNFPTVINDVPIELYGKIKGRINVAVKQICWFQGQPEMGNPHRYSIAGEATIGGQTRLVNTLVEVKTPALAAIDVSSLVFKLMGGERIPDEWL